MYIGKPGVCRCAPHLHWIIVCHRTLQKIRSFRPAQTGDRSHPTRSAYFLLVVWKEEALEDFGLRDRDGHVVANVPADK